MVGHKFLTQIFTTILLTSLLILTIAPINVQAVSKPSIPSFTLKLVEHPYDVPPTYTKNPLTDETSMSSPSYHVENRTIEVTIKNQPFTPYKTSDDIQVNLCYNVSVKPHYSDEWRYYPAMYSQIPLIASKGDYSVLSFGPDVGAFEVNGYMEARLYGFGFNIPDSGQLDFRVEALIGYYSSVQEYWPVPGGPFYKFAFFGESSGWSTVQTFTIPDVSPLLPSQTSGSPQNPNTSSDNQPQPSDYFQSPRFVFQPSFLLWVGALLFVGVTVAVVMVFLRRHLKTPNFNSPNHNK